MKTYHNFLIFLSITSIVLSSCKSSNAKNEEPNNDSTITSVNTKSKRTLPDTVTIIGIGDIQLGSIVPSRSYLPKDEDCSPFLGEVKSTISSANVAMANIEGVLTDDRDGQKKCNNPKTCYTFGMPTKFAKCFQDAGFDFVSTANNHSGDFNEPGRKSTIKALNDINLKFAGFTTHTKAFLTIEGVKYGFCAFAPNEGACDFRDYEFAKKLIKEVSDSCDITIVSFHGGAEGSDRQHITKKTEIFLGENRGNVHEFARLAIDAGADMVFGHGPHVTRAIDLYNNRFIIYSLGNFFTYSQINISGVSGLAPIVKVYTNAKGEFLKAQIIPTFQTKGKPVQIDPNKKVIKVIQDLTKTDLPECNLNIADDGWVTLKNK